MSVVQDHHREQTIGLSRATSHPLVSSCLGLGLVARSRIRNLGSLGGFGQQFEGLIPAVLYQQKVRCRRLYFIHVRNISFQPAQALGESAFDAQNQYLLSSVVCLRHQQEYSVVLAGI